jgi:hypothetical protein
VSLSIRMVRFSKKTLYLVNWETSHLIWDIDFFWNTQVIWDGGSISYKNFMHFVEILKLCSMFEVMVKKIHIYYKIHLKTLNFFIVYVRHYGAWKSPIFLSWAIFSTPYKKCWTCNCNKSLNFKKSSKKIKRIRI